MPVGTFTQTDIPDDQVDAVEGIARAGTPPPVTVTRTRQPNGLWTITATFGGPTPAVAAAASVAAVATLPAASPPGKRGSFAIDSLDPVSNATLATFQTIFGAPPAFWGRYFYAPGQMNSSGLRDTGHYSARENSILRANSVRVLPIARQTGNIGRDADTGTRDAASNVAALLEVFPVDYLQGADPEILIFLDSEGNPSLSTEYYSGWASGIITAAQDASGGSVRILPAVYGSAGDRTTWASLAAAIASGASCAGLWVASWGPVTKPHPAAPLDWSDAAAQPAGTKLDPPVLGWQFSDKGVGFDANQVNPAHDDILLSRLVMPPGP